MKKIRAKCNCCCGINEFESIKEFKENGAYRPIVHFMCKICGGMASLLGLDIPAIIFSKLVNKISKEHGFNDRSLFERMKDI